MRKKLKTEAVKANEFKRLEKWVKNLLGEHWDKFDLRSEVDSSLSYQENKSIIRDKLKVLTKDIKRNQKEQLKEEAEQAKAGQEKLDNERKQQAEKEVEEYNNSIRYDDNKEIDAFYKAIHRPIDKVCQGYSNVCFIRGVGGIGKSYQIRKRILLSNAKFFEVTGDCTPAYLYRLLYEHNGKVIWFKDVTKLLVHGDSLNLLKSATETDDKRILTKSNYSKQQEDLPDMFVCKCRFIFDYNHVPSNALGHDFEAFVTRGDYVELGFYIEEIKQLLRLIAKEKWQKEVTEHIIKHFESNGLIKLNLRTQKKAFGTYEFAQKNNRKWKEEIKQEVVNQSRIRTMLYQLIGNNVVRTTELKKLMLKNEVVNTIRSADLRVLTWLYMDELYKHSEDQRDFYVGINPPKKSEVRL